MHQAQHYIDGVVASAGTGGKFGPVALGASQAARLGKALLADAEDYLYSGAVSVGDAVQDLERSMYTWATVKLYYAVFYFSRALLAAKGTALVYEGTRAFSWESAPGAMPIKRDGPTHKAVLNTFSDIFPTSPLLSQDIDTLKPLNWLMRRREEVNYTVARFTEPEAPAHFKMVARTGVRKSVSAYVGDSTYLYAFDPEHAMLAFPIEVLKQVMKPLTSGGVCTSLKEHDRKYLASLYFDKAGPFAEAVGLIKG